MNPIDSVKEKFKDKIVKFHEKSPRRYYIDIRKEDLLDFVDYIFNELHARYVILSGVDNPPNHIEVLYHFSFDDIGKVVTLRVTLDRENPKVESISRIVTGAQWIEREIQDILGVKFLNHPDPRRFILPDDWPEGKYPLRKDYKAGQDE